MTDQQQPGTDVATSAENLPHDPAAGPADQIRLERPDLDPYSLAALAVNAELDRQISELPDAGVVVAINPSPLVTAVIMAFGENVPRIPAWLDEPRRVGGVRVGDGLPAPEVEVDLGEHPATVRFTVTMAVEFPDGPRDVTGYVEVPYADALVWGHNVLSAGQAVAKRSTPAG